MTDPRDERGYTLLELILVAGIVAVVGAMAVPMTGNALTEFRLSGDARALMNSISLVKMRAAANFTKVRLFADLGDNGYYIQTWNKTTSAWDTNGGVTYFAQDDAWGVAGAPNAPSNTQTSIGQSAVCQTSAGVNIGNSSCIIFNSRGVPVDTTGTPTAQDAFYLNNGDTVYGITVSATGLIRLWRAEADAGTVTWNQQ